MVLRTVRTLGDVSDPRLAFQRMFPISVVLHRLLKKPRALWQKCLMVLICQTRRSEDRLRVVWQYRIRLTAIRMRDVTRSGLFRRYYRRWLLPRSMQLSCVQSIDPPACCDSSPNITPDREKWGHERYATKGVFWHAV